MGAVHARAYSRLATARLVGVVDIVADRADKVAGETGAQNLCSVAQLALHVRACSVAVPTSAHLEIAEELIEHGIHVLVEKPLAPSVAEAQRLVDAARKAGVKLMVGHTERFNPVVRAVDSEIRRPGFVEIHRMAPFTERGTDVDVVLDLMIHDLDLLAHFVPSPVVQVDAVGVPVLTPHWDIANARLRFESGTVANLTASRVSMERMRKIRFFEQDLYVSLDTAARTAKAYRLVRSGPFPRIETVELGPPPTEEPVDAELEAFVAAIREGREPPVRGEEGVLALELAERVRDAMSSAGPAPK